MRKLGRVGCCREKFRGGSGDLRTRGMQEFGKGQTRGRSAGEEMEKGRVIGTWEVFEE